MSCQQVAFEQGQCLVEIESKASDPQPRYTAFISVLENDGAIVRPVVSENGHRVRIHATSEALALGCAVIYLNNLFGAAKQSERAGSLGSSSIGRPYVVREQQLVTA